MCLLRALLAQADKQHRAGAETYVGLVSACNPDFDSAQIAPLAHTVRQLGLADQELFKLMRMKCTQIITAQSAKQHVAQNTQQARSVAQYALNSLTAVSKDSKLSIPPKVDKRV